MKEIAIAFFLASGLILIGAYAGYQDGKSNNLPEAVWKDSVIIRLSEQIGRLQHELDKYHNYEEMIRKVYGSDSNRKHKGYPR